MKNKHVTAPIESPVGPDTVEPSILPVVQALAALPGVKTVASCEGHDELGASPYVFFRAPAELVSELALRIRGDARLRYYWDTNGSFDGTGRLCFTVRALDLDHASERWLPRLWHFRLRRGQIDRDLVTLAELVRSLAKFSEASKEVPARIQDIKPDKNDDEDAASLNKLFFFALPSKRIGRMATVATAYLRVFCQHLLAVNTRLQHPNIPPQLVHFYHTESGMIRQSMQAGGVP